MKESLKALGLIFACLVLFTLFVAWFAAVFGVVHGYTFGWTLVSVVKEELMLE